jgi:hypothetical protein
MKYLQYLFVSLVTFFLPIQGLLIAVGAAIALDTCTGLYKASKTGVPIISKRFRAVISKMLVYELCMVFIYCIDYHLLSEFFNIWFSVSLFFTKVCSLVLILAELISIKENIEEAHKFKFLQKIRSVLKTSKEIKDDVTDLIK